jgi:signal transduction histidine kinase
MKKVVFRKDVKQTRTLIKAARNSSKRAVIESKVLGLTITYMKDGVILEEDAQGNISIVNDTLVPKELPYKIEKGMILHTK